MIVAIGEVQYILLNVKLIYIITVTELSISRFRNENYIQFSIYVSK